VKLDSPQARAYVAGETSFLVAELPVDAIATPWGDVIELLRGRFGTLVDEAVGPDWSDPASDPASMPAELRGPNASRSDTQWMKRSNVVGINVRTIGSYAEVVKYALTLPDAFDAIHLLPIWEPGVVKSLYGPSGWGLNVEFWSDELAAAHPHLTSMERQLRAVVNVLHVMGKAVGMDVIPHTDRFSEMVLAQPSLFEWMRVTDGRIVAHPSNLHEDVERRVYGWLDSVGSADPRAPQLTDAATFFAEWSESDRLLALFGDPHDWLSRIERRVQLVSVLHGEGFEPVPATMGVPFRGIQVDPDHAVVDELGMTWHDYVISDPHPQSRVFNPLARFKLFERLDDNANWEIDFARPIDTAWAYVCDHYARVQRNAGFDFMRGDMSHVQMRPDGVPKEIDEEHYDILSAVKEHIRRVNHAPAFGYFAETFLPPRDVFAFGEEMDHLEASHADVTLGDLQSVVVGSNEFLRRFRRYLDDLATRKTAVAFGVMTADKDDPRFDEYYRAGNEVRYFSALFLTDMASYTALGFETRDLHTEPVANEQYTKLFVFQERGESNVYPSKARHSDSYRWGTNFELFERLTSIRVLAEELLPQLEGSVTRWLIPPDATTLRGTAVWTQQDDPRYIFCANYDLTAGSRYFGIPDLGIAERLTAVFSTEGEIDPLDRELAHNGYHHRIENLQPGEGRVYRVDIP
jgi:hypothetical protein